LIVENAEISANLAENDIGTPMLDPNKVLSARIDWSRCAAAQRRPGVMSGAWTVRGTRIPVEGVIQNYNAGYSAEDLATRIYRGLPVKLAREIIEYAAERS
jgi:uncharacterized protein (DUF433 family)